MMLRLISTCLLTLLFIGASAQTDTVYYNSLWQEVKVDSLITNYRIIKQLKRKKYSILESHGKEYIIAEYKTDNISILRDYYKSIQYLNGKYTKYIDSSLVMEGDYSSGLKHGVWSYYKDGVLIKTKLFEHGILIDKKVTDRSYVEDTAIYSYTAKMPDLSYSLDRYIGYNLMYPKALLMDLKESRVIVSFIVDEDGQLYDIKSDSKDVDPLFQEEAVRLVSTMPDWEPGRNKDMPVKVKYAIPIKFEIKYLKDTCYFDEYWQPVPISGFDTAYYRVIDDQYGYPYYVVNYYKNGKIESKGRYIADQREELKVSSCDFYRVGNFIDYYESGYKHIETKYNRVDIVGKIVTYYDSSDVIASMAVYKNGVEDSTWVTYYPTGEVESVMTYSGGQLVDDVNIYYSNGKISTIIKYKDGVPVSRINYNIDGTVKQGGDSTLYWYRMPVPNYDVNQYLAQSINYPIQARDRDEQGRVIVKFFIDTEGNITEVEAIKTKVDKYLVREAERVVKSMPKWQPGIMKGKPIKVFYTLPIVFKLDY